jgi:hypothetical protein
VLPPITFTLGCSRRQRQRPPRPETHSRAQKQRRPPGRNHPWWPNGVARASSNYRPWWLSKSALAPSPWVNRQACQPASTA